MYVQWMGCEEAHNNQHDEQCDDHLSFEGKEFARFFQNVFCECVPIQYEVNHRGNEEHGGGHVVNAHENVLVCGETPGSAIVKKNAGSRKAQERKEHEHGCECALIQWLSWCLAHRWLDL